MVNAISLCYIEAKRNHIPNIRNNVPIVRGSLVKDKLEDQGEEPRGYKDGRVRIDAQRNIDALLQAAVEVFSTSGVDATVREIVEKAGVGIGTYYRHFPQRADLVAAVFRREIDACADAAPVLAAQYGPGEALAR